MGEGAAASAERCAIFHPQSGAPRVSEERKEAHRKNEMLKSGSKRPLARLKPEEGGIDIVLTTGSNSERTTKPSKKRAKEKVRRHDHGKSAEEKNRGGEGEKRGGQERRAGTSPRGCRGRRRGRGRLDRKRMTRNKSLFEEKKAGKRGTSCWAGRAPGERST